MGLDISVVALGLDVEHKLVPVVKDLFQMVSHVI